MACPKPCNKSPFSAFTINASIWRLGMGDQTWHVEPRVVAQPGIWALGLELWFQEDHSPGWPGMKQNSISEITKAKKIGDMV
jgi:hypothetical protein